MNTNSSTAPRPTGDFSQMGFEDAAASQASGQSVDLVRFLLTHWRRLAAGFGIGLAVGAVFYLAAGHRYDASTRILVSKLASTPLQEGEALTFGDRAEHIQLIKSDVVIRRAFKKANLGELPTFAGSDEPIRDLIEDLKVKRSAGEDRSFLNVFDISYQNSSRQDAATVIDAVIEAYDEYLAETRREQSQEVLDLIGEAEGKLQAEIAQLKQEYQAFRKSSPILFHTPVGKSNDYGGGSLTPPNHYLATVDQLYKEQRENQQRRTNVQAQIDVLQAMQENGESRKAIEHYVSMSMAQHSTPGSGGGAANPLLSVNPAKDRLDSKLLEARIREANFMHHFGGQHPEVEKLRLTIQGIRDAYHAEGLQPPAFDRFEETAPGEGRAREGEDLAAVYRKYLEEQLRQIELSDRSIERQLTEAIAQAKKHAEFEMADRQFSDELQRKQALWDGIVSKLNVADFTKQQAGYRMTRISDVLVELSIKRMIKIVGALGVLGSLAIFGLLYFREWQDTTLKSLDEVGRHAEATLLGGVPHFEFHQTHRTKTGGLSEALRYYHQPGSREAEAYRSVRTTLFLNTSQQTDRVIQVSSPEPGDGKTTSVANLAIAVAQSGKRVLLIDGDLRRPAIHRIFGLSQDVGLCEVLRNEVEWINAVHTTEIDGLSLLTAGQTPANPAELLSASGLPALLKAARAEFDYVLIDSPPLLAVSDPCIISTHADGMLLVVRMQKSTQDAVIRTREMLTTHGVEVYGIIANDMTASDSTAASSDSYAEYFRPAPAQAKPAQRHAPQQQVSSATSPTK